MCKKNKMYHGSKPIYNRGIIGNTTYDVLNRLENTVFSLRPGKVFLLIGANDLLPSVPHNSEQETAYRIMNILEKYF